MILVKVTAEKDGIPVEYSFEADESKAIPDSLALIETLKEHGFKAPSKPSYGKRSQSKNSSLDYNSESKTLRINVAYIADKTERDKYNELFKAAFKDATARYIWFNADDKVWQYPPPNNTDAKPLSAADILALENHEFFKPFDRGDGFQKAIVSIREYIAMKEKETASKGNPF